MKKVLCDYIDSHKDLPAYRSKAWADSRLLTVGGSEIATAMGINPYSSPRDLVLQKLGIGEVFNGNYATAWGSLLEDILEQAVCEKFECQEILKTSSLKSPIEFQTYTPDGLAVISKKTLMNLSQEIVDFSIIKNMFQQYSEMDEFIALFEFKCPAYRNLGRKIPDYYFPQIAAGLCTIPITHFGIFIEAKFQTIPYAQLSDKSQYCVILWNGSHEFSVNSAVIDKLIKIAFAEKTISEISGDKHKKLQETLFLGITTGKVCPIVSPLLHRKNEASDFISKHQTFSSTSCTFAVTYVMFDRMKIYAVDKNLEYAKQYAEDVKKIVTTVQKCLNSPLEIEKILDTEFSTSSSSSSIEFSAEENSLLL